MVIRIFLKLVGGYAVYVYKYHYFYYLFVKVVPMGPYCAASIPF